MCPVDESRAGESKHTIQNVNASTDSETCTLTEDSSCCGAVDVQCTQPDNVTTAMVHGD